jgi:hypothetical protein
MSLVNVGDKIDGHKHNFDHTTIVFTGAVHVRAKLPDGAVIERNFTAPDSFLVRAEVEHEITSTAPGTICWCVYSHRTPQGEVVEQYTGWEGAYQ